MVNEFGFGGIALYLVAIRGITQAPLECFSVC